jgi:hypothetical protein
LGTAGFPWQRQAASWGFLPRLYPRFSAGEEVSQYSQLRPVFSCSKLQGILAKTNNDREDLIERFEILLKDTVLKRGKGETFHEARHPLEGYGRGVAGRNGWGALSTGRR